MATEAEKQLLDLIRNAREQQLLFLRTIKDAADSAGEQVQNVRLNLLDDPPDVSTSDVFIDILITLALGPLASKLIGSFTKTGMRWILRDRRAIVVYKLNSCRFLRKLTRAQADA